MKISIERRFLYQHIFNKSSFWKVNFFIYFFQQAGGRNSFTGNFNKNENFSKFPSNYNCLFELALLSTESLFRTALHHRLMQGFTIFFSLRPTCAADEPDHGIVPGRPGGPIIQGARQPEIVGGGNSEQEWPQTLQPPPAALGAAASWVQPLFLSCRPVALLCPLMPTGVLGFSGPGQGHCRSPLRQRTQFGGAGPPHASPDSNVPPGTIVAYLWGRGPQFGNHCCSCSRGWLHTRHKFYIGL